MTAHTAVEGAPLEVRSRAVGRPDGWFAACTCGWTGQVRERQSTTLVDQNRHERDQKQKDG